MVRTYRTEEQILRAITKKGRISGVISVPLEDLIGGGETDMGSFNDFATEELVGYKYGCYLEDIVYRVTGCDPSSNEVFISVEADAKELEGEILYEYDCEEINYDIEMQHETGEPFFLLEAVMVDEWFDDIVRDGLVKGLSGKEWFDHSVNNIQLFSEVTDFWVCVKDLSAESKRDVERGIQASMIRLAA